MINANEIDDTRRVRNIVLVHGAFADGSGWLSVYRILKGRGYNISIAGHANLGMDQDVAVTQRVLNRLHGPVILVGHSYGGAIITQAGMADNVAGLVYVSAFAPDEGETLGAIAAAAAPDHLAGFLPPEDGFIWYDKEKFHIGFCADVPHDLAEFMADSQIPLSVDAFGYVHQEPAWKHKPSWYCVATQDHSIQPDTERFFAGRMGAKVTEIHGSHVIYQSHPEIVADVIDEAARTALG
jgi:pimeloyl-ACP methyl ester carboxylesterase